MITTWLEPEYYNKFSCKCGACRHACCKVWRIAVREEEYYRMIGMECSEELHRRLEAAFVWPDFPTDDRYKLIEPDWRGQCRMLDEDGLCMLQKECGEEALCETCRVYPRSLKSENGRQQACCTGSCERTIELLMVPEKIRFVEREMDATTEITESVSENLFEIGHKVIEFIQDDSASLSERITAVCKLIAGAEKASQIERQISSVEDKNGELIRKILNAALEISESCESVQDYLAAAIERSGLVDSDRKRFLEHLPDWEKYVENFICNNMLYSAFPCTDKRIKDADSVYGLALEYLLVELLPVAWFNRKYDEKIAKRCEDGSTYRNDTTNSNDTTYSKEQACEDVVDAVAACYHLIEHTSFYYNAFVELSRKQ